MECVLYRKFSKINIPRYPLNRDNVGKWILNNGKETRNTARAMSNLFQNVSFQEFISILDKIGNEIVIISKNSDLVLYLPDFGFKKSFTFVSILLTYILIQKKCYFSKITFDYNYFKNCSESEVIVLCDDTNYSCKQILNIIKSDECRQLFLAVPFKSLTCSKLIEKYKKEQNIVYSAESVEFLNFEQYISKLNIDDSEKNNILEILNYNHLSKVHGLYFDFKLPDTVSICTDIFDNGKLLHFPGQKYEHFYGKLFSLIENCEDKYSREYYAIDCPPPFYKSIKYTFDGEEIQSLIDLEKHSNLIRRISSNF